MSWYGVVLVFASALSGLVAIGRAVVSGPQERYAKGLLTIHWVVLASALGLQLVVSRLWIAGGEFPSIELSPQWWLVLLLNEVVVGSGLVLAYRRHP